MTWGEGSVTRTVVYLLPCPNNTMEQVALNTAYLWGQGVKQVALSLSTAFAVTNDGLGYVWGGVNKWWRNTEYDPTAADTDKVCVGCTRASKLRF